MRTWCVLQLQVTLTCEENTPEAQWQGDFASHTHENGGTMVKGRFDLASLKRKTFNLSDLFFLFKVKYIMCSCAQAERVFSSKVQKGIPRLACSPERKPTCWLVHSPAWAQGLRAAIHGWLLFSVGLELLQSLTCSPPLSPPLPCFSFSFSSCFLFLFLFWERVSLCSLSWNLWYTGQADLTLTKTSLPLPAPWHPAIYLLQLQVQ